MIATTRSFDITNSFARSLLCSHLSGFTSELMALKSRIETGI